MDKLQFNALGWCHFQFLKTMKRLKTNNMLVDLQLPNSLTCPSLSWRPTSLHRFSIQNQASATQTILVDGLVHDELWCYYLLYFPRVVLGFCLRTWSLCPLDPSPAQWAAPIPWWCLRAQSHPGCPDWTQEPRPRRWETLRRRLWIRCRTPDPSPAALGYEHRSGACRRRRTRSPEAVRRQEGSVERVEVTLSHILELENTLCLS